MSGDRQNQCPRCRSWTKRHCDNQSCTWRVCINSCCQTFGVDEAHWTQPRPQPHKEP